MVEAIVGRQAIDLMRARLGARVTAPKLSRAGHKLAAEGRLSKAYVEQRRYVPEDVDRIVGELARMAAGWFQRRNVASTLEAWLELRPGEWWLMRVPPERVWDAQSEQERISVPEVVECHEFPTARLTGRLRRSGERYGLPAYEYEAVADSHAEDPDAADISEAVPQG